MIFSKEEDQFVTNTDVQLTQSYTSKKCCCTFLEYFQFHILSTSTPLHLPDDLSYYLLLQIQIINTKYKSSMKNSYSKIIIIIIYLLYFHYY